MTTREGFLGAGNALERDEFTLPDDYGDGAVLTLQGWSGAVRSDFEKHWVSKEAKSHPGQFRFDVIQKTVVDGEGKPLFTPKDQERVLAKPARLVEDLFESCCQLNGLREKDVEELEGNSESGQ